MNLTREHLIAVELVLRKRFSLVRSACPVCTEQADGLGMDWTCSGGWCCRNDGLLASRGLLLVLVVSILPMLFHLLTHPALLRRRVRGGPVGEPDPRQKIILLSPSAL